MKGVTLVAEESLLISISDIKVSVFLAAFYYFFDICVVNLAFESILMTLPYSHIM